MEEKKKNIPYLGCRSSNAVIKQKTMIRLKLKEPCDRVFIGASLVNPLTGEKNIIADTCIYTGSITANAETKIKELNCIP